MTSARDREMADNWIAAIKDDYCLPSNAEETLAAALAQARAEEREAILKIVEPMMGRTAGYIAAAIRARGEEK